MGKIRKTPRWKPVTKKDIYAQRLKLKRMTARYRAERR